MLEIAKNLKAIQQHQVFLDGGKSYAEFWDALLKHLIQIVQDINDIS